MADFSLVGGFNQTDSGGKLTASSKGTVVTSGASDTFGSWVEMIASSANNSDIALIRIALTSSLDPVVYQVGVGSAGNEEVICESLLADARHDGEISASYYLPLKIAEGSRVAVRSATTGGAGRLADVTVDLFSGEASSFEGCASFSANGITSSAGTVIDPGGTINTKGSWVELTASTSNDFKILLFVVGNNDNGGRVNADFLFDIAIGGSGSEEIIAENLFYTTGAGEGSQGVLNLGYSIPSGTRLAVRSQSSINDATDRLLTTVIYGGR